MVIRPVAGSLTDRLARLGRLPSAWRLPLFFSLYVMLSVSVFGGVAVLVIEQRLAEQDAHMDEMMRELERREFARHSLEAALAEQQRSLQASERQLERATAEQRRLTSELEQNIAELAALEDERNLARERARLLDQGSRETARWLETAQRERLHLARERETLEARLTEVDRARERAEGRERDLRSRLGLAEQRLAEFEFERDRTEQWLAAWIDERLGAIETVLEITGIAPEWLLTRASAHLADGQGGPLLPLDNDHADDAQWSAAATVFGANGSFARASLSAGLVGEIDRLEAAERLLKTVPLAAPLDHFRMTSGFGPRRDPLTRRPAQHSGLDFAASTGSEVMATAPGEVTHAGRAGSYGIMVEVDHLNGITTRYAHLSRTLVEVGDRVELRVPIGIIGSTGRSTGRHLHYEVSLDGRPVNPARFIAAGRQLLEALGS